MIPSSPKSNRRGKQSTFYLLVTNRGARVINKNVLGNRRRGCFSKVMSAAYENQSDAASAGLLSAEEILPLVYSELRRLAAQKLAQERPGQTLQATALVHEAWLRLSTAGGPAGWRDRSHFFGAAAESMRRILVDRARQKACQRHGGHLLRLDLEQINLATEDSDDALLAMDEALERLGREEPIKAEIVKLRYFTGLNHFEIAEALGMTEPTVRRHWSYARAWLYADLRRTLGVA